MPLLPHIVRTRRSRGQDWRTINNSGATALTASNMTLSCCLSRWDFRYFECSSKNLADINVLSCDSVPLKHGSSAQRPRSYSAEFLPHTFATLTMKWVERYDSGYSSFYYSNRTDNAHSLAPSFSQDILPISLFLTWSRFQARKYSHLDIA